MSERNGSTIKLLLMSEQFIVKSFHSAAEVLDSELERHHSCLLTDRDIKEIGGLELQKRLVDDGTDIPVIVFTAVDSPGIRQQAKLAGAIGYVQKPLGRRPGGPRRHQVGFK